jgi:hypothetical protein
VVLLLCSIAGFAETVAVTARIELLKSGSTKREDSSGVVVWLTPVRDAGETPIPSSPPRRQLLQKNKTFAPHLLVIPVGTAVDFPNQDPFFHNVFSLFEGKRFDLGLYESGSSRSVIFNRPGISYIFCNIHPEMSAVVIAMDTPFYAISDRTGNVTIPNVPIGRYDLRVWHERVLPETLKAMTRSISVADASKSLGVLRLMEQRNFSPNHLNKYGKEYDPAAAGPVYVRP